MTLAKVSSARRLAALQRVAREALVDGDDQRRERDDRPWVGHREEGQRDAEPGLCRRGGHLREDLVAQEGPQSEPRVQGDDEADEHRIDGCVGEPERGDRQEGGREVESAWSAARVLEDEAAGDRREREHARVEGDAPGGCPPQPIDDDDTRSGDEPAGPRAEDEHRGEVDTRGEAERLRVDGVGRRAVGLDLEELRHDRPEHEQGERSSRRVHDPNGRERRESQPACDRDEHECPCPDGDEHALVPPTRCCGCG